MPCSECSVSHLQVCILSLLALCPPLPLFLRRPFRLFSLSFLPLHPSLSAMTAPPQKNPLHVPSPFRVPEPAMTPEQKEQQYVHDVYQVIAPHFSATRYKVRLVLCVYLYFLVSFFFFFPWLIFFPLVPLPSLPFPPLSPPLDPRTLAFPVALCILSFINSVICSAP